MNTALRRRLTHDLTAVARSRLGLVHGAKVLSRIDNDEDEEDRKERVETVGDGIQKQHVRRLIDTVEPLDGRIDQPDLEADPGGDDGDRRNRRGCRVDEIRKLLARDVQPVTHGARRITDDHRIGVVVDDADHAAISRDHAYHPADQESEDHDCHMIRINGRLDDVDGAGFKEAQESAVPGHAVDGPCTNDQSDKQGGDNRAQNEGQQDRDERRQYRYRGRNYRDLFLQNGYAVLQDLAQPGRDELAVEQQLNSAAGFDPVDGDVEANVCQEHFWRVYRYVGHRYR
jgi:hypothetical protein